MYLVVDEMMELQEIHVSNGYVMVKSIAGPSVEQGRLA